MKAKGMLGGYKPWSGNIYVKTNKSQQEDNTPGYPRHHSYIFMLKVI